MARFSSLLIPALLAFALAPAVLQAEDPAAKPPVPQEKKDGGHRGGGKMSPEFDNVRKALEALSPEQRKRFQENFWRWSNLPTEEKKSLRNREEMRRKRMADEIESATKESGLSFDQERRELFTKRYTEERRKLEEQLRREMHEKRKPLVRELVGRLKEEFSAKSPAPSPAPAASVPAAPANTTPAQP